MIVGADGKFLFDNYKEAEDIIRERKGREGFIRKSPATELNIYLNLIRHLQEVDGLPVICFTLSRNRCDSNLENLMSISEESLKLNDKGCCFC
jgi:antiviral helicase SKI2